MEKSAFDMPIHQSLLADKPKPKKSQEEILKTYSSYFEDVVSKLAPTPVPPIPAPTPAPVPEPKLEPKVESELDPHDPIVLTQNLTRNIDSLSMLVQAFGQEVADWMARQEKQL